MRSGGSLPGGFGAATGGAARLGAAGLGAAAAAAGPAGMGAAALAAGQTLAPAAGAAALGGPAAGAVAGAAAALMPGMAHDRSSGRGGRRGGSSTPPDDSGNRRGRGRKGSPRGGRDSRGRRDEPFPQAPFLPEPSDDDTGGWPPAPQTGGTAAFPPAAATPGRLPADLGSSSTPTSFPAPARPARPQPDTRDTGAIPALAANRRPTDRHETEEYLTDRYAVGPEIDWTGAGTERIDWTSTDELKRVAAAEPEKAAAQPVHAAPPEGAGRGGRNVPAAIGIGLLLGAVVLFSLFTRPEAYLGLVSVTVVLAVYELSSVLTAREIAVPIVPLSVGSVGMLVSAFVAGEEGLLVAFVLTAVGMALWRLMDGLDGAVRDVTAGVFSAAYVPFLAGFAILLVAAPDGQWRALIFMLLTVASDIGGYVVGASLGRHPMAPTVSPKKSWEGFAGSVLACMVAGAFSVQYLLHGPWWAGVVVGGAAALSATVGDLGESLLKRDLGVKDMGRLLPGHGGIMDRLDSLLPTAPVVYVLLAVLIPT